MFEPFVRLNAVAATGNEVAPLLLSFRLKDFRRVLFCLSQKLIVPSEPAVEKVPCTGWNEIALTANSWALVSSVVRPVPALGSLARWHLKEKFSLE